jgi:hypothetical protein
MADSRSGCSTTSCPSPYRPGGNPSHRSARGSGGATTLTCRGC